MLFFFSLLSLYCYLSYKSRRPIFSEFRRLVSLVNSTLSLLMGVTGVTESGTKTRTRSNCTWLRESVEFRSAVKCTDTPSHHIHTPRNESGSLLANYCRTHKTLIPKWNPSYWIIITSGRLYKRLTISHAQRSFALDNCFIIWIYTQTLTKSVRIQKSIVRGRVMRRKGAKEKS